MTGGRGPEFDAELALAGLRLDGEDRDLLRAMWEENYDRRAALRAEPFALHEAPLEMPPAPGRPADAWPLEQPPESAEPLHWKSVAELAGLLRRRAISSMELVRHHLDRIERFDPALRAFMTVDTEGALDAARIADLAFGRGEIVSPLQGIPVALKDVIAVRGVRLTGGSRSLTANVAKRDAHVVETLRAGGAIFIGQTRMHELGAGMAASDGDWATGRNPYDPDRIPGGSSSGSAVGVAAGMAPCALGTDAAGSVRMPAGNCNLVGLKPTFGLLSRDGLLPYCWALDTIATMTRTVTDAGFLLEACLGVSGSGAFTHSLEAPLNARRIGVPRRYFWDRDDLRSDVRSRCEEALSVLAGAGATLVEVDLPSVTWNDAIYTTLLAETYSIHGAGLRATPDLYGPWFRLHGLAGALVTADDLNRAHRLRARLAAEACAAFGDVEALVIPGQAVPATPFSTSFAKALTQPRSQFMRPWNVTGLPAIAVPCGFSEDGLPLSISFAGPYFGEAALLSIAAAYERETAFGRQRPNEARWAAA